MKRCLLISFWMLLCASSFGQAVTQKMLVGKWYLVRHTVDGKLILDRDDPQTMMNYYMKALREQNPDYTRQDSVDLEQSIYRTINAFANYFIEFNEDNTYRNTIIKRDANEASNETEGGTYQFNPATQKMLQTEGDGAKHEISISIKNKLLKMQFSVGKKNFIMEFRKRS